MVKDGDNWKKVVYLYLKKKEKGTNFRDMVARENVYQLGKRLMVVRPVLDETIPYSTSNHLSYNWY